MAAPASCQRPCVPVSDLKERLVAHILKLKQKDVEFARHALKHYDELLPWMELKKAIKEQMDAVREEGGR